jgi:hypothetical protein
VPALAWRPGFDQHPAAMNRPTRQRNRLLEKITAKETLSHKKPGKRTKRWKKAIEAHKPVVAAPAEG